jgi:uncharacterized membrane protein YtjA (UPF0391 family)
VERRTIRAVAEADWLLISVLPSAGAPLTSTRSSSLRWNRASKARVIGPQNDPIPEDGLLYWALMFLVVALVAAIFGFGGIASTATGIAQVLFVIAIIMFLVSLLAGYMRRNP